jgi:hypothetical protein
LGRAFAGGLEKSEAVERDGKVSTSRIEEETIRKSLKRPEIDA